MAGHTPKTITVDDCSPIIDYQPKGAWSQKREEVDETGERNSQYHGGSYTFTTSIGATASFSFNGTSLTIYGAKWVDYGNYSVILDGMTYPGKPFTTSSNEPQLPLFNITSLRYGTHVVTLENTAYDSRLDIDRIEWTTEVVSSGNDEDFGEKIVDNRSDNFEYHPEGAWWLQTNMSNFMDGTGHTTSTPQAYVVYTFSGDSIRLFGSIGPYHSPYTIKLDDWPNKTLQGNKAFYKAQSLLFYADNLGPGIHNLMITNEADMKVQIDYAMHSGVTSYNRFQPPHFDSNERTDDTQIIGFTVIGIIILALIIAVSILARQNRSLWKHLRRGYMVQSQFDSTTPFLEYGLPTTPNLNSGGYWNERMAKGSQEDLGRSRDMLDTSILQPPAIRPFSWSSASTLIAEAGSATGDRIPCRNVCTIRRTPKILPSAIRVPPATSILTSPLRNELSPSAGQQFIIGSLSPYSSPNQPEFNITVEPPDNINMSESPSMPPRSLVPPGRSSPRLNEYDRTKYDPPIQRERPPSPVPALLGSGHFASSSDPADLPLTEKAPRQNYRPRINESQSERDSTFSNTPGITFSHFI